MKKFELNVVNFDNEDVIATSCEKEPVKIDLSSGNLAVDVESGLNYGDKIKLGDTTYTVAYGAGTLYLNNSYNIRNDADTKHDGIYHLEDGVYTYCEDGHNEKE